MPRQANEDVSKLPQWAQTKIEVLEKNVEFWKRQAMDVKEGKTGLVASLIGGHDDEIWLPRESRIKFFMNPEESKYSNSALELYFDRNNPGWVNVYANRRIMITPTATNVIQIIDGDRILE